MVGTSPTNYDNTMGPQMPAKEKRDKFTIYYNVEIKWEHIIRNMKLLFPPKLKGQELLIY